jgi:hypothetical protein
MPDPPAPIEGRGILAVAEVCHKKNLKCCANYAKYAQWQLIAVCGTFSTKYSFVKAFKFFASPTEQ